MHFISEFTPPNIALGKPTSQIDDFSSFSTSNKAVDGNRDPVYNKKSCVLTKNNDRSWWAVDLKREYTINKVVITNRQAGRKWLQCLHNFNSSMDN